MLQKVQAFWLKIKAAFQAATTPADKLAVLEFGKTVVSELTANHPLLATGLDFLIGMLEATIPASVAAVAPAIQSPLSPNAGF
jgi:hypothetical protein